MHLPSILPSHLSSHLPSLKTETKTTGRSHIKVFWMKTSHVGIKPSKSRQSSYHNTSKHPYILRHFGYIHHKILYMLISLSTTTINSPSSLAGFWGFHPYSTCFHFEIFWLYNYPAIAFLNISSHTWVQYEMAVFNKITGRPPGYLFRGVMVSKLRSKMQSNALPMETLFTYR